MMGISTASFKSMIMIFTSVYDTKWRNDQKEAFNIFNNVKEH